MSSRSATDIFVVWFRSPPVIDRTRLDSFTFQLLNNRDGLESIVPSVFVGMNEVVRLAGAISAVKNRRTRRIRTDNFIAPARTVGGLRARGEKFSELSEAAIHLSNLN